MKTFKQLAEAIKKTTGKNQFEFHGTEVKDEKKEVKEHVEQIDETAKVETKKYSWGTMKTVHHGSSFSVPLHPEHHKAIHALKDQQEHKFKTEDGRHWTAKRDGEHVHLHSANDGPKTKIKHSDLKEEKDTVVKDKSGKLISFKHEGDWKKANPKKNPEGKVHNLAGQALKKAQNLNKEEVEIDEATKYVVHYHNEKGEHVNSSKAFDDKAKAQAHADKGNKVDKVGGKYSVKAMQNEQAPVAPVPDRKYIKGTPEWKAHKEKSKPRTGHPTNVKEASFDDEGNLIAEKKSYTEFLSLLEYETDKNGKYVHKGNYGTSYKDPEGADDADDKQPKKVGRKVGSKVGPKANLGNSKLHQGK